MRIEKLLTDETIIRELGERLARMRLDRDLTQAELANQAGVGLRTVQRLEKGTAAPQLTMFIRILRALDIVEHFDLLVPEPIPSPMQQLKMRGKLRKRASGKEMKVAEPKGAWTWGDET
ncbi:MAG: helix-turn-helix domain-containing protein [Opitutales bacterium]|jgi:transcriptional regulator with XRE-family HTH domain|nr:helix-turn-helix domain-containing protein [Opitutales bacterium]MDP4643366.1 helix-turn-helix domain-containing protein [Opitutales bacterium]MDP4694205.1 helix-turn-helix domain-containing protein [Opitutales bacterium]MDP4778056.1 helix-turn-helix domain-containing protein [Opitutales bacterium]MDP4883689.1 helix-turn-helix domain-containing protein [Opitutales bacterium]